ncbi:hypothetical protein QAD02_000953 [Eretmocerus hayati]|uniref:Uncharacterized protein n=1 Tax=Eretmocerus hayati TaxID=131215 RepID=A0ACC2NH76_9HYME|nr:hypothetical protein QAD02_000953 [Eretmocerus hayati]
MCKIYHLLAKYKPFIVSAYCGGSKPPSAEVYLEGFVKELDELCEDGVIIDGEKYEVKIKCFICNRPARSFVKCCTNHGGYYACERCCVEGLHHNDRMVYPVRDCEKRTDASFTMLQNIGQHNSISPLTKLKKTYEFGVALHIRLFDFMHLGFLRITKGLLKDQWFSGNSNICRENQLKFSLRLEFRLILLQVGPFVFKNVLPEDEYNRYLLLHVASRIICSKDLYKKYGPHAQVYFARFALLGEVIYGLEFVSLSVHSLTHLVEDTQNMDCPASEIDAFLSEYKMRFVKKHIRSGYKPLIQLCKKVERLGIPKRKDGSVFKVADSISLSLTPTSDQVLLLGTRLKLLGPAYEYPTSSIHLGIYRVTCYSICEVVEGSANPLWTNPIIIVPNSPSYITPKPDGQYVRYLGPPWDTDKLSLIMSFVRDRPHSPPPPNWLATKCVIKSMACRCPPYYQEKM